MNGFLIAADVRPTSTGLFEFTKKFTCPVGSTIKILSSADSRYQLYLNGHLLAEGPCQGSSYVTYYEESDGTDYLTDGENTLFARVLYARDDDFIAVYRKGRPMLWVNAEVKCGDGDYSFSTDKSWECVHNKSYSYRTVDNEGGHISLAPYEDVTPDTVKVPVPVINLYEAQLKNNGFNTWGIGQKYTLLPRPIPQMYNGAIKHFEVVKKGDGFIELDAGEYTTAKVYFALRGEYGKKVKITYSECYTFEENGKTVKHRRDDSSGNLRGFCDTVTTNGGVKDFSPFWYRAFRFIRIEFEGFLDIVDSHFTRYLYPMNITGSFECSDNTINNMWPVSINTVRCSAHEVYVDCPYYEQQQYDMDSALEAIFTYRFTSDTRLQRKCITDLAHSQVPDGMIMANYPSTHTQIISGYALFWVLMLSDYLKYTGDRKFVLSMTGTLDKIMEGYRSYTDDCGMLGVMPYWTYIDWVPGWVEGVPDGGLSEPLAVSTLTYCTALKEAAYICRVCGRGGLALEYEERRKAAADSVYRLCYDTEKGLYRNTPTKNDYSEHTTVWAILSECVTGEEAHALMERTIKGNTAKCSFAMNHYMLRALEKSGWYCYADKVLDGWRYMLQMNCTTWCENPDSPRSECHGWSSAPAYEMSAVYLGVMPETPGYEKTRIAPYTDTLDFARGTVPTPFGDITVSWKKENGTVILDAEVPKGITATVSLGERETTGCGGLHLEA